MTDYRAYVDNLFRWRPGRQNPAYSKMLLLANPFVLPFDVYLLRFRPGSEIESHRDTVAHGRHYRLNVVLRHALSGGEFQCEQTLHESRSIKLFRPDLHAHSVSRVDSGSRYVLSIGWVLK